MTKAKTITNKSTIPVAPAKEARRQVTVIIPEQHLPRIIAALEFHAAYLRVTQRDGRPLLDTVEELKRTASADHRNER